MSKAANRPAESLNGVAAKVLAVVPFGEPITVSGICTELGRHGSRIDYEIVHGCLRALASSGHVKESPQQYFRRTTVASQDEAEHKEKAKPAPLPANVVSLPMAETVTEREPLESIGVLAQRLRESGRALLMWAEDLERLGLEFEQRVDAAGQDGKQLAQLRNILKNLGV
jgi:hypothetical protein